MKRHTGASPHHARQRASHPQCFMFCGLSIRMASLIFRSWSGHALVTVILWSSDCLGLLGVGWRTTCTRMKKDSKKKKKKKKQRLHKLSAFVSRRWIFDLMCNIRQHRSVCLQGGLVIMCVCVGFFFFQSDRLKWVRVEEKKKQKKNQNSALLCLPEEEA